VYLTPIADVIVPVYILWLSNPFFIALLFLAVVLIEAAVLRALNWGPFLRSLLDSFLMNLASTLVGFFLINTLVEMGLAGVLLAWAISVVVEGFFLALTRLHTPRRAFLAALSANLTSYLLIVPATWLIETLR